MQLKKTLKKRKLSKLKSPHFETMILDNLARNHNFLFDTFYPHITNFEHLTSETTIYINSYD